MTIQIIKKTAKSFKGQDGNDVPYFWYIGKKEDGMALRFGSTDGSHEAGQTKDLLIEPYEQSNGGTGYREIL